VLFIELFDLLVCFFVREVLYPERAGVRRRPAARNPGVPLVSLQNWGCRVSVAGVAGVGGADSRQVFLVAWQSSF
jgi:hypothetical protein